MKYLLDTHAWIWSVADDPRLSRRARTAIESLPDDDRVALAAISLKEAAWHLARGRMVAKETFGAWPMWLRAAATAPSLEILPLTVDVAIESAHLGPAFPRDPADRLIAATARVHDLTLITSDGPIRRSRAVRTLW